MTKDKSDYAFPVSTIDNYTNRGMTLRQWYAGMALQGMVTNGYLPASLGKGQGVGFTCDSYAAKAFELADAMLKEGGE